MAEEEAVFSFILESLNQLVVDEENILHGVKDQVGELVDQLKAIRWFLRDELANQEGAQRKTLEWVIQVRNLAYEAENVIETYAIKAKFRRGRGIFDGFYLRRQLSSDIESLLKRLTSLTDIFHKYGIRDFVEKKDVDASSQPLARRTYSAVNPHTDLFVGMEDEIEILVGSVVGEEYRAVAICGMGGIGKTTLARKVYHDSSVRSHFDVFLWISISGQWKNEDLLYKILVALLPEERDIIGNCSNDEKVRKISSITQNKRCIMVLDDVWQIEVWGSVEPALHIGNKGSKVLVTTRILDVAMCIDRHGYTYIHRPRLLNKDESWTLFSNKFLQHRPGGPETLQMEELGKEMVDYCCGIPLALLLLGGILESKISSEEWILVQKNLQPYLRKGKNIGERDDPLSRLLELSYYDLPYQLKPCFLYLSKYGEDEEIEADTLYQSWMAEGLVLNKDKSADDRTMMGVAERYLEELAERCIVFVEMEQMPMLRRFRSCRLHDTMRHLCLDKAREENIIWVANGSASSSSFASRMTASRLYTYRTDGESVVQPAKNVSSCLLSVSVNMNCRRDEGRTLGFDDFVMRRVLILEGLKPNDEYMDNTSRDGGGSSMNPLKLSSSIAKLIHLRYLSLRNTYLHILPSSISNLSRLETLDLRCKGILRVFNVIWKLENLRHLYLPNMLKVFHGKMSSRSYGSSLLKLDGLTKLEILDGFNDEFCNTKHLSTLTNLRSLTACLGYGLQDFINELRKLKHLQFLKLSCISDRLSDEVHLSLLFKEIFSLVSLEHLIIFAREIRALLPKYQSGFGQNLLSLELRSNAMETILLSTLEKLPNLRRLNLGHYWFGGAKVSCHAMGFQKLESLYIGSSRTLETWEIEKGAMPNLSHLTISGCEKLKMIPDGLRYVTSLKEFVIRCMPEEFVKRAEVNADGEEGEDFHKIHHIKKVKFQHIYSY